MTDKRHVLRRGRTRLTPALTGVAALVSGTLLSFSMGVGTPAGASSLPAQGTASSTSGLGSTVSDLEGIVGDLSLSNVGAYIEGSTQCPVSEVGYVIAGAVGPPPCAPGQIGG